MSAIPVDIILRELSESMESTDAAARARAAQRRTTYRLRRYTDLDRIKTDEYAYWQSRTPHERMAAVSELTTELDAMKGQNVFRLQRSLVRVERS